MSMTVREEMIKKTLLNFLSKEPEILEIYETIIVTAKLLDYEISYGFFGKESAKDVLDSDSNAVILLDMKIPENRICLDFSFTDGKLDKICCCKNEMRVDCHQIDHGSNENAMQKIREYL